MSITRHHIEWLSLVPNSGPFLSLPVLAQAFPQGLDAHDADHARRLRRAFGEWDENQLGRRPDPGVHRAWVKFVLGETLGYDELLAEGQAIPQTLKSEVAEYGETLRPDWIVNDPTTKKARLLVQVYPRSQSLTKPVPLSRWHTSPDTRMMQLLHDTGIRLGIVTNGDHWMMVNAPKNETTGYASWYANLWLEEPVTLRAFRTLLCADRLFSVPEDETLEALLDKSASDQQEVTDQLGYQVRKAVEVLIQALDKADQDHGRKLLADLDEKVLYESALTVMMRLVFLFCAEERELLLLGDELYDKNYAVSTLREQLRVTADQFGEEILGLRYDAWTRLLTSFRAVYTGAKHDRLKLPAYGGSLFDPDRFPFLEGRKLGTSWKDAEATPLPVSNRTVLHLLEALQVLQVRLPGGGAAEARKLSFRSLDIEQIGHVYEGLLDHTGKRAAEPVLGLQGTRDKEPEIALAQLEKLTTESQRTQRKTQESKELIKFLKDATGRSESALRKALSSLCDLGDSVVSSRFRTACQDSELWKRVKPFAGLVRLDTNGYPVIVTTGSIFVTAGTDRRSSGTHYTPKSLTEPIVQYTLEPLVYVGPAEGLPKDQWTLRSAKELLSLKICDMACGSGAFLVQGCRYLSERLLEAWDAAEKTAQGGHQDALFEKKHRTASVVRITPYGMASQGRLYEQVIPLDPEERQTYALRTVAQRCLYGVDKNPLAVEMAKLSLWLLTLAKDKPFEFLDHAIRCGDSLVGIHNIDQLRKFNLDGKGEDNNLFLQFLDPKIKEAIALRRQITEMQANTVEEVEQQDRLLREANEKIDRLKCAADLLISAEFTPGSAADKRGAREDAAIWVAVHFHDSSLAQFCAEANTVLDKRRAFHWPLEFPEVIIGGGGFDAFVCNPPFQGGSRLVGDAGEEYATYLVTRRKGLSKKTDLCCHFFRRSDELLNTSGSFGLIATNTVTQGASRRGSLDHVIDNGRKITFAFSSFSWPGDASLTVAVIVFGPKRWQGRATLDHQEVVSIDSLLDVEIAEQPQPLNENGGICFLGVHLGGTPGFVVTKSMALEWIAADSTNAEVVFPFVGGDEIGQSPLEEPTRWIVSFGERSLEEASRYRLPLDYLSQFVRPERAMKDGKKYPRMVNQWWKFWHSRNDLYKDITSFGEVLVRTRTTSNYRVHGVRFCPSQWVHTDGVIVFKLNRWTDFAGLQSTFHAVWAQRYSSSHNTGPRYIPTDCFETFPRPTTQSNEAELAGKRFHERRHSMMVRHELGITGISNLINNPSNFAQDVAELRQLLIEMDHAVAAAYGWTDLDLGHGFHETKQGVHYTVSEPARREVLARLLKLNHERYAEEVKQGLHEKKKPKARNGKKNAETTESGGALFGKE